MFNSPLGMTWGELRDYIDTMPVDYLDTTAMLFTDQGEFRPIGDVHESMDDPMLDDGHPYLVEAGVYDED